MREPLLLRPFARCSGMTKAGHRCKRSKYLNDQGYCFQHVPKQLQRSSNRDQDTHVPQQQEQQKKEEETVQESSSFDEWALAHACMEFLSETHPRMMATTCGCDGATRICRPMAMVKWMQTLLKLTHQRRKAGNGSGGDPMGISHAEEFLPLLAKQQQQEYTIVTAEHDENAPPVFRDLYLAVSIFGAPVLSFLPALFEHMHNLSNPNRTTSS